MKSIKFKIYSDQNFTNFKDLIADFSREMHDEIEIEIVSSEEEASMGHELNIVLTIVMLSAAQASIKTLFNIVKKNILENHDNMLGQENTNINLSIKTYSEDKSLFDKVQRIKLSEPKEIISEFIDAVCKNTIIAIGLNYT